MPFGLLATTTTTTGSGTGTSFNPLGNDLLALLVLAVGAAMVFGYVMALVRPPQRAGDEPPPQAPRGRSLVMIGIGLIGSLWALATLLSS